MRGDEGFGLGLSDILFMLFDALGFEIIPKFDTIHPSDLWKTSHGWVDEFQLGVRCKEEGREDVDNVGRFILVSLGRGSRGATSGLSNLV